PGTVRKDRSTTLTEVVPRLTLGTGPPSPATGPGEDEKRDAREPLHEIPPGWSARTPGACCSNRPSRGGGGGRRRFAPAGSSLLALASLRSCSDEPRRRAVVTSKRKERAYRPQPRIRRQSRLVT